MIEGNNPDRVQRKAYPIDNWAILGYGTVRDVADVTIRSGNEGRKVTLLQEKLALLGYLDAQYVTGKYASLTARAVSAFQKDHQLNETGVANQSTQLRLNEAVRMYYMETPAMWTVEE